MENEAERAGCSKPGAAARVRVGTGAWMDVGLFVELVDSRGDICVSPSDSRMCDDTKMGPA